MNNRIVLLFVILGAVVALALMFFVLELGNRDGVGIEPPRTATSSQEVNNNGSDTPEIHSYGEVAVGLGETVVFPDVTIQVLSVEEDSRCPIDAQCVTSGTVKVRTVTESGMGVSRDVLELGTTLTTEAEAITFLKVSPERKAGVDVSSETYVFTFKVEKRSTERIPAYEVTLPPKIITDPAPSLPACYVGGCSGQLCTDDPGAASTCEYREEYLCYKTATCERQQNGQCGWTQSSTLNACLMKAQQTSYPQ
jgi:hypothetical protein